MKLLATFGAAAIALALATPAQAKLLNFAITGDYNAVFQLDSKPTPDVVYNDPLLNLFAVANVSGIPGTTAGLADITFFRGDGSANSAGLLISDHDGFQDWLLDAGGPRLYSGSEDAPTFLTGTFALSGLTTRGDFTLTISNALPEPATWALMIAGLGLTGAAMRRSRKTVSVRYSTI